jgi:hypothetical protein
MGLGSEIWDPEKTYSGSRIRVQGSKRHQNPDPGSGSATLEIAMYTMFSLSTTFFSHVSFFCSKFSFSNVRKKKSLFSCSHQGREASSI